jgi:hypothetical protein
MSQQARPRWFAEAIATPFQKRSVQVVGCLLNYLVWGDSAKPPLILVHGGAAHALLSRTDLPDSHPCIRGALAADPG